MAQRPPGWVGEDEVVGARAGPVASQVLGQRVDEEGRDVKRPSRRPALGVGDDEVPVHLCDRLADREVAAEEVDVADPQSRALGPAQAEDATHQDERPVLGRDGLR